MADVNDTDLISKLDFVNEQEKQYFAQAQLGEQARSFLASPVGRYLHGRAKLDFDQAKDELVGCNPDSFFGRRKFRRLQRDAELASRFMRYLSDALVEADHAGRELETYRDRG